MKFYKNINYSKVMTNLGKRVESARVRGDEGAVRHYLREIEEIRKHLKARANNRHADQETQFHSVARFLKLARNPVHKNRIQALIRRIKHRSK